MPTESVGTTESSGSSLELPGGDVDFLFVVVEVPLFEEKDINGLEPKLDRWGNYMPPDTWLGFHSDQKASEVFRYQNGTVTRATHYTWCRPDGPGCPGGIGVWDFAAVDKNGSQSPIFLACQPYTTRTIFDGGDFMGTVIQTRDASVDHYFDDEKYKAYDGENLSDNSDGISTRNDRSVGSSDSSGEDSDVEMNDVETTIRIDMRHSWTGKPGRHKWIPMRFIHDIGTSRISLNQGYRYVAGRNPTWLPSVVYPQFAYPDAPVNSNGLGGDMATIIGLLALTQEPHHCGEAFSEGKWEEYSWNHTRHPKACKIPL